MNGIWAGDDYVEKDKRHVKRASRVGEEPVTRKTIEHKEREEGRFTLQVIQRI